MSAKKYLKMPQPAPQPAAKTEKEEQLWIALKRHILRERERKKQELEAVVEEERQRKQREQEEKERKEKNVMTLGETKDEIQALEKKLQELRNEKQQLFLQLKKVLNEDDRKRQQSKEQQAAVYIPPPAQTFMTHNPHQPRPMQNMQPHLIHQKAPQPPPAQPLNPGKRSRSPSTSSPSSFDDASNPQPYALQQKQPQYCQPGTMFYPISSAPPQPSDNRPPQLIYSNFRNSGMHGGNIPMPIHPAYHVDLSQQKTDLMPRNPPPPTSVYHTGRSYPGLPQQPQSMKPHNQQITIEKIPQQVHLIYNPEDVRKDIRVSQSQPPPPHHPMMYSSGLPTNQMPKSSGSITQGYIPRPPPNQPPLQYRHRY